MRDDAQLHNEENYSKYLDANQTYKKLIPNLCNF